MASLSSILSNKSLATGKSGASAGGEFLSNLDKGIIHFFTPGVEAGYSADHKTFCWVAPGNGCAILEIWGAAGSSGSGICCSNGISSNPGAYSRKIFPTTSGSYICGTAGYSCGSPTLQCRGCSEPTEICWVGSLGNGCMCAMGGRGGYHFPSSMCNTSPYCCFVAAGFCHTNYGTCCGIICHYCNNAGSEPDWLANAWGGDVNKNGGFSCVTFACSRPLNNCSVTHHVAIAPGIFSEDGSVANVVIEHDTVSYSNSVGNGIHQLLGHLSAMSRTPSAGVPYAACWSNATSCNCYSTSGCAAWLPHGVPGIAANACASFCGHGWKGGNGAVRIQFIGA